MEKRQKIFAIRCPKCGHHFEKTLPTAIFAHVNDDKNFSENFGILTCPSCDGEFILNYRFAYTDEIDEFMIVNDPEFVEKKARLAFSTSLGFLDKARKDELYKHKVRITYDYDQVREKIAIFKEGLDDRVVELMKVFLLESEDFAYKADQVKSFTFTDDKSFALVTELNVGVKVDFSDFLYDTVKENYKDKLGKEISYMVDRPWALDFLSRK